MAPYVEANSLSDITQLASNPPKYPRNPTEDKRRSLTLYIARVPGTRDIILTTLRPQLKNVTAEDVASSLYYLHLNTNEDLMFLEEEKNARSDSAFGLSQQKLLPRKPLPESARSSLDLNRQTINLSINQENHSKTGTKRKPVPALEKTPQLDLVQQENEAEQSLTRRPLGPRPLKSEPLIGRKPLAGAENQPWDATIPSPGRPASPSRFSSETETFLPSNLLKADSKNDEPASATSYTITIIRRDPSSGSQWNIGTVSGHPRAEGQKIPTINVPPSRKRFFDMSVHITNPGYGTFRDSQTSEHNMRDETAPGKPLAPQKAALNKDFFDKHAAPLAGFHRQIRMEGSSIWNRPSIQHKRTQSEMPVKQGTTHARSSSASNELIMNDNVGASFGDSQPKGYMFMSPWGGRCKFSTSSSGRSLRCKHTLPDPVSASMTMDSSTPSQLSVSVSEIRFNLPTSVIFNSMTTAVQKKSGVDHGRFSIPKFENVRKRMSSHREQPVLPPQLDPSSYAAMYPSDEEAGPPLPPRPHRASFSTESSEDETPANSRRSYSHHPVTNPKSGGTDDEINHHIDLSLGQEKAGGGNRGKRAKLGKLIIHDEGFKMLDLIVAANMAVWWSVWGPDAH